MTSIRGFIRILLIVCTIFTFLSSASAQDNTVGAESMESEEGNDEKASKPWGGLIIVDNAIGLGTFVQGVDQRASYTLTVDARVSWKFDDHQTAWLRVPVSQEIVQNYDSVTTANQTILGDVEARYFYNNLVNLDDIGLKVTPYLWAAGGTSQSARYQTRLLSLRPGVKVFYKLGPAQLIYEGRFTKNFNRYTSPTVDGGLGIAVARLGGSEDLAGDVVAVGGVNSEFSLLNRLTAYFAFPANLGLTVYYTYIQSWSYEWDNDDDFTAANADTGRNLSDLSQSVIDLSWQTPISNLTLSAGAVTLQTPKTADNDGFRFPFFDLVAPNSNSTTFYLDAIASF